MPPDFRSSLITRILAPFGPHHCANACASVHAFQTASRGALKLRVIANSVKAVAVMALSPIGLRSGGGLLQRRDLELLHLQHRLHHAVRLGAIRISEQARQR